MYFDPKSTSTLQAATAKVQALNLPVHLQKALLDTLAVVYTWPVSLYVKTDFLDDIVNRTVQLVKLNQPDSAAYWLTRDKQVAQEKATRYQGPKKPGLTQVPISKSEPRESIPLEESWKTKEFTKSEPEEERIPAIGEAGPSVEEMLEVGQERAEQALTEEERELYKEESLKLLGDATMEKHGKYFEHFREDDKIGGAWELDKASKKIHRKKSERMPREEYIREAMAKGGAWDYDIGTQVHLDTEFGCIPVTIKAQLEGRRYLVASAQAEYEVHERDLFDFPID